MKVVSVLVMRMLRILVSLCSACILLADRHVLVYGCSVLLNAAVL
jgi:hypothetical protein